jgi:hypothetical protein
MHSPTPTLSANIHEALHTTADECIQQALDFRGGNPKGLSIIDWLRQAEEPDTAARVFHHQLLMALLEAGLHKGFNENLALMRHLHHRGVNIIDLFGQSLSVGEEFGRETLSLPFQQLPDIISEPHKASYAFYLECVEQLDEFYALALDQPSFVDWSKPAKGLPVQSMRAKLFALVFNQPSGYALLAHSPFLRGCQQDWLVEMQAMTPTVTTYRNEAIHNYWYDHGSIHVHQLPEGSKPLLRHFMMSFAEHIADLGHSATAPGHYTQKAFSGTLVYGFAPEDHQQMAVSWLKAGQFKAGQRELRALFWHPDLLVEALRVAGVSQPCAEEHFCRCVMMAFNGWRDFDLVDTRRIVDEYREHFKAHGYADIIKTRALDGLCINLELGQQFHAWGYLRQEDMSLGVYFAPFHKQGSKADPYRLITQKKIALAIELKQWDTLKEAARDHFQNRSSRDLSSEDGVRAMLTSPQLPPSEIISTKERFHQATRLGVSSDVLLRDPALHRFADAALERDLGL